MKTSKYGAQKTAVDGIIFASKYEAKVYGQLKLLVRAKVITDLTLQPRYPLVVNGQKICTYVSDFAFNENGKKVTVDAKGYATKDYKIKAKLFKALYPDIEHREA